VGMVLVVTGQTDDELFDLVGAAVAQAEARLRRLAPRRRTLDDIFTAGASEPQQPQQPSQQGIIR
jgi:hypothetical protein